MTHRLIGGHSPTSTPHHYAPSLKSMPFIHSVSILSPNQISTEIAESRMAVVECNVEDLVSDEFISHHVRGFRAFSIGTRPERGNSIAVFDGVHSLIILIYTGRLLLSLDKDTYEQLGLTGSCQRGGGFKGTTTPRFDVVIDLRQLKKGRPLYDKVTFALSSSRMLLPKVRLMCIWQSNELVIPNADVTHIENGNSRKSVDSVPCITEDVDKNKIMSIFEWLGMIVGDIVPKNEPVESESDEHQWQEYVSKYTTPSCTDGMKGHLMSRIGCISNIDSWLDLARQVSEETGWCCIMFTAHEDACETFAAPILTMLKPDDGVPKKKQRLQLPGSGQFAAKSCCIVLYKGEYWWAASGSTC